MIARSVDSDDKAQITRTLLRVSREGAPADELMPLVYDQLRAMAGRWFRGQGAQATLQPTALVHEAYLRLVDRTSADWKDRAHFIAIAALAMRQIVVQRARARFAEKRAGDRRRVALDELDTPAPDRSLDDVLALEEALERLVRLDKRHARITELRFFGGLTMEEIALVLGVSTRTVELDWRAARAWLRDAISGPHVE